MDTKTIPLALARKLYVTGLFPPALEGLPVGKEGVAQVIDYLGYVQIDTIHVIQRAHHHTLWSRRPDYSPEMLHELQAVDRRVFEYWGHAASILPMSDYRFYLPSMRAYRNPRSPWVRERLDNSKHLFDPILDRIRTEGPLATGDFEHNSDEKRGSWWDWKPAKSALELLFWRGDLMISQRRNFTRVYDLTERVLPPHVDTTVPDSRELGRFLVRRALNSFSIAPEREISDHIHGGSSYVPDALREMVSDGEVVQLQIEGLAGLPVYALPQRIEAAGDSDIAGEVHILSPFDNATIHRRWVKRLFGFDYTIECYVP
ncbi:MAG: crosslink repair DNA glycosylase YcaQ family protein, partial [Candidatus Brocadiia bacterium]